MVESTKPCFQHGSYGRGVTSCVMQSEGPGTAMLRAYDNLLRKAVKGGGGGQHPHAAGSPHCGVRGGQAMPTT
jgi:hypothetical protein